MSNKNEVVQTTELCSLLMAKQNNDKFLIMVVRDPGTVETRELIFSQNQAVRLFQDISYLAMFSPEFRECVKEYKDDPAQLPDI